MNRKWGREETDDWPSHKPLWTISALAIGVLVFVGMAIYQAELRWTPLQRYWFPNYFKMDLAAGLGLSASNYRLPEVEDHLGRRRLALETDVVPWEGSLPQAGTIPLILSDEARRQGLRLVLEPKGQYKNINSATTSGTGFTKTRLGEIFFIGRS